jgi:hypothetical protein
MYYYNGEKIEGDPVAMVAALRDQVYDSERFQDLDLYMEWMAASAWRLYGKSVAVEGVTLEFRCASFLAQLENLGVIKPAR